MLTQIHLLFEIFFYKNQNGMINLTGLGEFLPVYCLNEKTINNTVLFSSKATHLNIFKSSSIYLYIKSTIFL